jgi:hypothetical protein
MLAAALVVTSTALGAQGQGPGSAHDRKLDARLRQRVASGADDLTAERVIVRLKPGTRRGLVRRLQAAGFTVDADLALVEGIALRLPRRLLRQLARDNDVLSVSVDAPVRSDGLVSPPVGAAENGGYSLRRTLGLEAAGATAVTRSYQQGDASGYASVVDGSADFYSPNSGYGSTSPVWVEGFGTYPSGLLVRFDNLVGTGAGQIPPGSTITSVSLRVHQKSGGSTAAQFTVHRMLTSWQASVSWNGLVTSGPGLPRLPMPRRLSSAGRARARSAAPG